MAVTINYYPNAQVDELINLGTYAANTTLRLTGAPANTKYVFQIWDEGDTIKLVDIRQSQNQSGEAVFNIGEIIQNYVETHPAANTNSPFYIANPDIVYSNSNLSLAKDEIFPFRIKVGSDNGTTVTIDTTYGTFFGWNALHNLYDMLQNDKLQNSLYRLQSQIDVDPETIGCILKVNANAQGIAMTDRPLVDLTTLPGGIPTNIIQYPGTTTLGHSIDIANIEAVLQGKSVDTDGFTLYWRNDYWNFANLYNTSIGGIRFDWYDGDTYISSNLLPNITQNGGGPDTYPKEGNGILYPFNNLGIIVGQTGTSQQRYRSITGTLLFQRPAGLTHYYVYPVATQESECGGDFPGYSDWPTHKPVRVNLREEMFTGHLPQGLGIDLRGCTDYDPILFRWTNSAGYQDHAWFMKKNTYTKNTKRETFYRDLVDYNVDSTTDPQFLYLDGVDNDLKIGGTQIYNNSVEEIFTATTGWMSDEFAQYLQWMFQSSNVTANGSPITLVTSTWTEKNFTKDKLYQYEVTYKKSSPINAQNR
jgi:hypothetical protein